MDEEQKPTEAENQAEKEPENVDFGDDESQNLEEKQEASQETDEGEEQKDRGINQEKVQQRIDKITFEKHEEIRRREKIEEEYEALKASLEEKKAKEGEIEIPELPDVYDDNYAEKLKAREEALLRSAEAKALKKIKNEQEQKRRTAELEKRQAEIMKNVDAMYSSAEDYGIKRTELEEADRMVSKFIRDPDLASFIVSQKEAALIVKYLSSSATELESIKAMSPLNASVYIATDILAKAQKLKPDLTKTPDPVEIPKGKSTPKKDPFLEGVQLE